MCTVYSRSVPTASTDTIRYVTIYYCPTTPWQVPTPSIAQVSFAEIAVVDWVIKVRASRYTGFHWRQQVCCELAIIRTYTYDKHR